MKKLVFLFGLLACQKGQPPPAEQPPPPPPTYEWAYFRTPSGPDVYKFHDLQDHVMCWITSNGGRGSGMHCIPDREVLGESCQPPSSGSK